MKPTDIAAWTIACSLAVTGHAAGVLAFASLLETGHPQPRSELRLDRGGLPRPRAVGELANSGAALSQATDGAVVEATADGAREVKGGSESAVVEAAANSAREVTGGSESATVPESAKAEALQPAANAPSVYGSNSSPRLAASSVSPALAENVTSSQGSEDSAPAVPEAAGPPAQPATANAGIAAQYREHTAATAVQDAGAGPGISAAADVAAPIAASDSAGASSQAESPTVANAAPASTGEATPAGQAVAVVGETAASGGAAPVQTEVAESAAPVTEAVAAGQSESEVQDSGEKLALATPIVQQHVPQPQRPAAIDVARAVSDFSGGSCFLAVSRQDAPDRWKVTSYGAATAVLDAFANHLKAKVPAAVALNRRSLQMAQCAAIDFANGFVAKARGSFVFATDNRRLVAGDRLSATISGFTQKWIYILLVDDEGVAQDISQFAVVSGGGIRLDVPVHVRGDGHAKTQLLFALSSDRPLSLLDMKHPQPLLQLMPMLRGQIVASKALVEMSIADFEVE